MIASRYHIQGHLSAEDHADLFRFSSLECHEHIRLYAPAPRSLFGSVVHFHL